MATAAADLVVVTAISYNESLTSFLQDDGISCISEGESMGFNLLLLDSHLFRMKKGEEGVWEREFEVFLLENREKERGKSKE